MSDLEEQVGETLAAMADGAPDAEGLAAGARRRHRARRQRRIAVVGVAAAVAVAASAVALGTRGDDRSTIAEDPTKTPSATWQTLRVGDALASLPPDWKAYDCPGHDIETSGPVYAAPGEEPCADGTGTLLYEADVDMSVSPGVVARYEVGATTYWQGYVGAGGAIFSVTARDRDLAREILATAHLAGQPEVDASGPWVNFERLGIGYDIPQWWGVGEDGNRKRYAVCAVPGASGPQRGEQINEREYSFTSAIGDNQVTVTAPTQAVAELVWATIVEAPDAVGVGGCLEEDFNVGLLPPEGSGESSGAAVEGNELDVVTFGDIVLEVPAPWSIKDDCGTFVEFSPGGERCSDVTEGVRFVTPVPASAQDHEPGAVFAEKDAYGTTLWTGYVLRGAYAVFIRHTDKAIAEELLTRVRP